VRSGIAHSSFRATIARMKMGPGSGVSHFALPT
jgi:hypothetical protein